MVQYVLYVVESRNREKPHVAYSKISTHINSGSFSIIEDFPLSIWHNSRRQVCCVRVHDGGSSPLVPAALVSLPWLKLSCAIAKVMM
jgi:hypothetical protein